MRCAALILGIWLVSAPAWADRHYLIYEGRAFGVAPLGSATLDVDLGADTYRVSSTLRSGGLLALFDRTALSAIAEGDVSGEHVQSRRYDLDHSYARKRRVTTLEWRDGAVRAAIAPNYRLWGEPPASEAQRAASLDPLSTLAAMGVQAARRQACAGVYPTFDGRFHYRMRLSGGRIAAFSEGDFRGQALRCTLTYEPVSGFEPRDGGRTLPTRRGEIWFGLGNPAFAPPVRIAVPLPVGRAAIHLVSWRRARVEIGAP